MERYRKIGEGIGGVGGVGEFCGAVKVITLCGKSSSGPLAIASLGLSSSALV